MIIRNNQRGFGAIEIIIIVATVALLGTLSVVAYNSFQKDDMTAETTTPESQPPVPEAPAEEKPCADGETTAAMNGTFCSEDIGIKFVVPTIFNGKLAKAENYKVTQGTKEQYEGVSAGMSELVFSAKLTGNDNFTFTIAKEPLRSGYVGVGHHLQNAYYNKDSGMLTTPMDDALVPSFMINKTRVYVGTLGDAGYRGNTYLAVINGKIVKIQLTHGAYMGSAEDDPATIDEAEVFKELDNAVRKLQLI